MSQLPADCLNEIFVCLEEDKVTLCSCLLVNRLWCEVSVEILWRIIRNYNTLIACLPNESKEILHKNGIITSITTSKPPMFNYAKFCKFLSIDDVDNGIKQLFKNQLFTPSQSSDDNIHTVTQEVIKLLMSQASLRELTFCPCPRSNIPNFASFPGAKNCLKNLSKLCCDSDIYPKFFYQLSQICHNLQSLDITFGNAISDEYGLVDLISVQKNLKCMKITQDYNCICEYSITDIITSLTKLPNTIIKLHICGDECRIPLSFVAKLTNLQEIILELDDLEDFKTIQYAIFPQLQILKFHYGNPGYRLLINFLENNGKNLKEFYVKNNSDLLNLAIAEFCPNLRKLFTGCKSNELEALKKIFSNCQQLESIQIWCGANGTIERELLEIVAKYSPRNVHELKLCYAFNAESKLLPEELESFFIRWTNRIPQKSLSFTIICNDADTLADNDKNMQIIEKYIKTGIIKEFKTMDY